MITRVPALLLALLGLVASVDHAKFRDCGKTGFCKRHRKAPAPHPYVVAPGSLAADSGTGGVVAQLHGGPFGGPLTLQLTAFTCGVARMRVTETNPLHGPRWEPKDILETSLVHAPLSWLTAEDLGKSHAAYASVASKEANAYAFGAKATRSVVTIHLHPFRAALYVGDEPAVSLNPEGKFYFEHHRKRDDGAKALPRAAGDGGDVHGGKEVVDYGEDGLAIYADGSRQQRADDAALAAGGEASADSAASEEQADLWEESFGSHHDSKPFGPASVGMDLTFERASHVYGLAEHAAPLNLPSTVGPGAKFSDPYRLWTLDVYDYELESPMALYGGVPLLLGHTASTTVGALWFNPTETYVDISRPEAGPPKTSAYWMSESGVVDLMLLPGPEPAAWSQR